MARVLAALLFLVAIMPVHAAEIDVRSGEHGDFTRLVLRIPEKTGWKLENDDRLAKLTIELPELKFSFDTVFDRVPRKRLNELRQSQIGAPLELSFACDCEARAFVQSGTLLVVDIRDRPVSKQKVALPLRMGREPSQSAKEEEQLVKDQPIEDRRKDAAQLPKSSGVLRSSVAQQLAPSFIPSGLGGRTVENRLYSRIMRGVDQEVLTLNPLEVKGADEASAKAQAELAETLASGLGLPNLRVTTVVDRDLRVSQEVATIQPAVQRCIGESHLVVEDWADETPFATQYASLRERLFGEFDKVDAEVALSLVRLYVHFGFGDEARASLGLLPASSSDHTLLAALAAAIDGRAAPQPNPLAGLQGCDTAASLWSVLSERRAPENTDTNAVLRSYGRLPAHLRAYLGPVLGEYLAEAGFVDAAQHLIRAVERGDEADKPSVAVVEAKLAGLQNNPAIEEQKLTEVIEDASASTHAPRALIALIEKRWSEGGSVTQKELLLADSFRREYRTSEIGPQLQTAYVIALGLSAQFDAAMAVLLTPGQEREGAVWQDTMDRILQRITTHADDITFLRHVAMLDGDPFLALRTGTANAAALRLNELGFFEDALRFADRPQDRKSREARAEIIARATLGAGRPHRALLELESVSGVEAERLRAEAMRASGALEQAAEALVRAGDLDTASRYVWLAGAESPLSGAEETRFGEIHLLGQALLRNPDPTEETPLAAARSLVEDSAQVRDQIETLLGRLQ